MNDDSLRVLGEAINEVNKQHAINSLATQLALVDAGILTAEQIHKARIVATHQIDQEWERQHAERGKENIRNFIESLKSMKP